MNFNFWNSPNCEDSTFNMCIILGFLAHEPSFNLKIDFLRTPLVHYIYNQSEFICIRETFVDLILVSSTCINKPLKLACYYVSLLVPGGHDSWGSSINTVCFYFFPFFQKCMSRIHDIGGDVSEVERQCPGMSWNS